jgi:hypothetical protein
VANSIVVIEKASSTLSRCTLVAASIDRGLWPARVRTPASAIEKQPA